MKFEIPLLDPTSLMENMVFWSKHPVLYQWAIPDGVMEEVKTYSRKKRLGMVATLSQLLGQGNERNVAVGPNWGTFNKQVKEEMMVLEDVLSANGFDRKHLKLVPNLNAKYGVPPQVFLTFYLTRDFFEWTTRLVAVKVNHIIRSSKERR